MASAVLMAAIITDGGISGPLSAEEENDIVVSGSDRIKAALKGFDHCLVGSFLNEGRINSWGMKILFQTIWPEDKQILMTETRKNLFIFKFPSTSSTESALRGGPWVFDGNILMLQQWTVSAKVEDPVWSSLGTWVQVRNLSPSLLTEEDACNAVHRMGKVLDSDSRIMSGEDGDYLRVRVQLDINKPLWRGGFISVVGEKIWLDYRYERIPSICEWCGRITHLSHACPSFPINNPNTSPGFGP